MTDKMREEFEARFPREPGIKLDDDGLYSGPWASFYNARWEAWKESREALVVDFTHCVLPDEFFDAVKDAGLKVKP